MEPLDERYFKWLYGLVAEPTIQDPDLTYWNLLRHLHSRPFVWFVGRDDNRVEDGKQLRLEFLRHEDLRVSDVDRDWIDFGCSALELMIAMSGRLQFDLDPDSNIAYWFWEVLMTNIGLRHCSDGAGFESCDIDETLNRVMFRQYEPDGTGGFFPLQNPQEDQRGLELWHQLSAYVIERMAQ